MTPIPKTIALASLACLVCCSGPVILLFVSGMALGAAAHELLLCDREPLSLAIAVTAVAALTSLAIQRKRMRADALPSHPPKATQAPQPPIACTLSSTEMAARLYEIDLLSQDALISATQHDLTLTLHYRRDQQTRVHRMVQQEKACCSFLTFDLNATPSQIEVVVTAPEAARPALQDIYHHLLGKKETPP